MEKTRKYEEELREVRERERERESKRWRAGKGEMYYSCAIHISECAFICISSLKVILLCWNKV